MQCMFALFLHQKGGFCLSIENAGMVRLFFCTKRNGFRLFLLDKESMGCYYIAYKTDKYDMQMRWCGSEKRGECFHRSCCPKDTCPVHAEGKGERCSGGSRCSRTGVRMTERRREREYV